MISNTCAMISISPVLLTPKFTVIEDGAFLADDTLVASYELGGGWIYAATTITINSNSSTVNSCAMPTTTLRLSG